MRYLSCSAAHCRSSASAASAACSASTEPMASDATPAAMSPTPARRICPSTPGPTVTARSTASLHPSRCRKMSSPFKIPACVRLSTSASSQTARGVAAARRGAAHFSRRVRVALSASPRAPKYRAACRMSMDSGFAKFRGLLGPMGIFRRLLLLNKV